MKQINGEGASRPRGRPRKDGELKQSSVRVRPALQAQLAAAAAETGQSIAKELESRLERTFTDAPMREPTSGLLNHIARAVADIEAGTGKEWDKNLTAWAMVREVLANGPVIETIPHPDPVKAKELASKNAELRALTMERDALSRALLMGGVSPTGGDATTTLGAAWFGFSAAPSRDDARHAIAERDDLPADIREGMLAQVDRLEELDGEIDRLRDRIKAAMLPYLEARKVARQFIHDTSGVPDLPIWLTAPVGMDEAPPRPPSAGMFGATRRTGV